MIAASLLAVTLAASPPQLEAQAARTVALSFEQVGRRTPVRDASLDEAARRIALHALDAGARPATELTRLTEAVSFSGGWDPAPRALVLKGSPIGAPLKTLEKRRDLADEPASAVGVGVAVRGDASALVILTTHRRAELKAFPRQIEKPLASRELCGRLEAPLARPEAWVTLPSGEVERAPPGKAGANGFCFRVRLPLEGRYTVEVLGTGPNGPEVAALFFVDVGAKATRGDTEPVDEPTDPQVARAQILERINALRKAHRAEPLELDPAATKIAQAYSERMMKDGFFAHVDPDGRNVGARLRAAGYSYRIAGENLGMASGPLAAHFGIEHSPGHRRNLIDPQYTHVGLGISTRDDGSGPQTILTQVLVAPTRASKDPVADAYEVLDEKRGALKLPSLRRHAVLERLAEDHARRALAQGEPRGQLPDSKLHERVFAELDDAKSASIDVFIADHPALLTATKAMGDANNRWVGIGAVKGDSARHGKGKYWVVVIYATPRGEP